MSTQSTLAELTLAKDRISDLILKKILSGGAADTGPVTVAYAAVAGDMDIPVDLKIRTINWLADMLG